METAQNSDTFEVFGLSESILNSVKDCGFTAPTPIQSQVIPHILSGSDITAQAQTGSGKTAAFGIPALHLLETDPEHTGLLVITPTRELAIQISQELARYAKHTKTRTVAIYGGSSATQQVDAIQRGANVIAATPGRLLDLLQSKRLKNFVPSIIVLDEADEMLNMGFLEDVQAIFEYLPEKRQILLFSATMPKPIQKLAHKILNNPKSVVVGHTGFSHQDIQHIFYSLDGHDRDDAFLRILSTSCPKKAIIFCRTKKEVDTLTYTLAKHGFSVRSLHGDVEQRERQRVTEALRDGSIQFLIATDVAARGLNISDISHIFNYQIPFEAEPYVHRAGRTGRAGKKGEAITLATSSEIRKLRKMLNFQRDEIEIRSVPTDHEMYELQMQALVKKVVEQKVHQEAKHVLDLLQEKLGSEELLSALASMVIDTSHMVKVKAHSAKKNESKHQKPEREESRFQNKFSERRFEKKQNSRFGSSDEKRSSGFGDKRSSGFGEKRSSSFGERRSSGFGEKRSSGFGDKRSSGFGDKRSSGFGEKRSSGFGDKRSKKSSFDR